MEILTYYKEASILEEAFPQAKSSVSKLPTGAGLGSASKNNQVVGVEYQPVPASCQDIDHCEEILEPC